jgi:hypothetical protein
MVHSGKVAFLAIQRLATEPAKAPLKIPEFLPMDSAEVTLVGDTAGNTADFQDAPPVLLAVIPFAGLVVGRPVSGFAAKAVSGRGTEVGRA